VTVDAPIGTPPTEALSPMRFRVGGMDCADCARTVERVVADLPGVATATVNFAAGTLEVTPSADTDVDPIRVASAVSRAGYVATPAGTPVEAVPWWRHRQLIPVLIGILLAVIAAVLDQRGLPRPVVGALYTIAMLIGGWRFGRAALEAVRVRRIDMNVLMTLSAIGAAILGEWAEGASVVLLFALGSTVQAIAFDRTRAAVSALLNLTPATATVLRDGEERLTPTTDLHPGDRLLLRPGERLAADGTILAGSTSLDLSALTGEAVPVFKQVGDTVLAGSLNGSGTIEIRATRTGQTSTLGQILDRIEQAQASKAPAQLQVDRFAAIYTPAVVVAAIALGLLGSLVTNDPHTWVYRALVLLVIACPCALVISTPVSIVSALGAATKRGILVKGGSALDAARSCTVVAFDKTGTLTTGRLTLQAIALTPAAASYGDDAAILALAAAVETYSEHRVARAVVAAAHERSLMIPAVADFVAIPGKGARARVGTHHIVIGSPRFAAELAPHASLAVTIAPTLTPLVVLIGDAPESLTPVAILGVGDTIRPDAAAHLSRLRALGITRVVVLTGDVCAVGQGVASAVAADDLRCELLPEDKAAAITDLRARHGNVIMVGDGINDAPALAAADVGVAMGLIGTDVALETADVVLTSDNLAGIADLVDLSRSTSRVITENITISLAVKVVALILGVTGLAGLWLAVLSDMGTSLVVTANGLRLTRWQPRRIAVTATPADPSAPPGA